MKTRNREQPKELSDAEFEAALHAALRDEGYLFPESADDVASLKATIDMSGVPTPDSEKFRQLLSDSVENLVELPSALTPKSAEVNEGLEKTAMAARNGGQITEEVQRRMEADRTKAENELNKKHDAR